MSISVLNTDNRETLQYIENCKSRSMVTGSLLRKSHYELGRVITKETTLNKEKSLVILVMMRAGLFFANGIADQIETDGGSTTLLLINNDELTDEDLEMIKDKNILIVDAVINTGKSLSKVYKQCFSANDISIATTVIPETSIELLSEYKMFTIRTSVNKYAGAKVLQIKKGKGPDTGDRLFCTMNIH